MYGWQSDHLGLQIDLSKYGLPAMLGNIIQ